jgi:hypothetical protein
MLKTRLRKYYIKTTTKQKEENNHDHNFHKLWDIIKRPNLRFLGIDNGDIK